MRRTDIPWVRRPSGATVLRTLLAASLLAPLAAGLRRPATPAPLGLAHGELAVAVGTAWLAWAAWLARRSGWRGVARAGAVLGATGLLAASLALVAERRASAFYTEHALLEGMAMLLALHVVAGVLGVRPSGTGPPSGPPGLCATAPASVASVASVADGITTLLAWLLGIFWALVAIAARDVSLVVLMLAGALAILQVVLRLADAAAQALRRPAAFVALVVGVAGGCATAARPLPTAATPEPPERSGPGCPDASGPPASRWQPARDTTPAPHPGPGAGPLRLQLNIPAFRLDVVGDSGVERSYGVAVGMRRYRTPVGAFAVHRIVWNPWWVPPKTDWARKDTVTPPGPANPMGRVKLPLGGPYYLHGTPNAASIGSAASHGCIRMRDDDAVALARRLQSLDGTAPGDEELRRILADTMSVIVDLPATVPVDIRYAVVELRGDSLLLHPDVYRRVAEGMRARALRVLAEAGYDTLDVRRPALAAALRRARTRHVAVPLDSLLAAPARPPLPSPPSP